MMPLIYFTPYQYIPVTPPTEVPVSAYTLAYGSDLYLDNLAFLVHADAGVFVDEFGQTLTYNGGVALASRSKFGKTSAYFNGTSTYNETSGRNSLYEFQGDFTVEGWFYVEASPFVDSNTNRGVHLVGYNDPGLGSNGWMLSMYDEAKAGLVYNKLYFTVFTGTTTPAYNLVGSLTGQLYINNWYHLAVTRSGNNYYMFVNGKLQASGSNASVITYANCIVQIGRRNRSGFEGYFKGSIEDLRCYNTCKYTSSFAIDSTQGRAMDQRYSHLEWGVTEFLLKCNGPVGSSSIMDEAGRVVTNSGVVLSSTQSKYGGTSAYFNGNCYLTVDLAGIGALNVSGVDFTVELWFYTTVSGEQVLIENFNGGSGPGWTLYITGSMGLQLYDSGAITATGVTFSTNTWYHVAVCSNNGVITFFVNGTAAGSFSKGLSAQSSQPLFIGRRNSGGSQFQGYMDDIRFYKRWAKYAANFTPAENTVPSELLPTYNQYKNNTVLLINGNGPNNSTAISDSADKAITIGGSAKISSAQSKYGGSSLYFDGVSSYLTLPYSAELYNWWTTDYTVEAWIYNVANASSSTPLLIGNNQIGGTSSYWAFGTDSAGKLVLNYWNGANVILTGNAVVPLNTWTHVAMSVTGTVVRFFVNGILDATFAVSGTPQINGAYPLVLGRYNTEYLNGYVQDIRILKGLALYTSNFTPPEQLKYITAQPTLSYVDPFYSSTALVIKGEGNTYANSNFVDNSNNGLVVTATGKVGQGVIGPLTGFNSATFPGNIANYLSVPHSTLFDFGSGNYTIECRIKTASSSAQDIISCFNSASPFTGWLVGIGFSTNDGKLKAYHNNGNDGSAQTFAGTSVISNNAWHHLAVVRNGSNLLIFVDGVLESTTAITTNPGTSTHIVHIGVSCNSTLDRPFNGQLCDLAVIKGVAKYTAAFTPSTTPVVADANTSLLLNFNNSQITEAMSKVNLAVANNVVNFPKAKVGTSSIWIQSGVTKAISGIADVDVGYGDFTFEAWVLPSNGVVTSLFDTRSAANVLTGVFFAFDATGHLTFGQNSFLATATNALLFNTWSHVALVRTGSTLTAYQDGSPVVSYSSFTANLTDKTFVVGDNIDGTAPFVNGLIEQVRFTRGARYRNTFVRPKWDFAGTASAGSFDLYWLTGTSLWLPCEGANSSTNIFDAKGSTINKTGSPVISTAQYPFSNGSSLYLNGSSFLETSVDSAKFSCAGNWTFEGMFYTSAYAHVTFFAANSGTHSGVSAGLDATGHMILDNGVSGTPVSTAVFPLNTWVHVAVTRINGTSTVLWDGVPVLTNTFAPSPTDRICIGSYNHGSFNWNGYVSGIRFTNKSRYGRNMSYPKLTERLPDVNVFDPYNDSVVLGLSFDGTNNSTTITDLRSRALSVSGAAKLSTTQVKFGTAALRLTSQGDTVSLPTSVDWNFASVDVTIEMWIYPISLSPSTLIGQQVNSGDGNWLFYVYNTGAIAIGKAGQSELSSSASVLSINTWQHVAVVKQGTTTKIYVNGSQVASGTGSYLNNATTPLTIGSPATVGGGWTGFNGYIDDLRITKYVARYTAAYPVPVNAFPVDYPDKYFTLGSTSAAQTIKTSSLIGTSGQGSIEFWVNMNDMPQSGFVKYIYSEQSASKLTFAIIISASKLKFYAIDASNTNFGAASSAVLTVNKWTHVVVTWDTSKLVKFYIDGVASGSATLGSVTGDTSIQSQLGGSGFNVVGVSADAAQSGVANIDNFRIYSTPIDQTKVTARYNNGVKLPASTVETDLLTAYNFNGSSGYVKDYGSGNNDFLINGANCALVLPGNY
jgi:hypothetical protein